MPKRRETEELAATLRLSIGLLLRRLRHLKTRGELTMPESSALARLERSGPMTAAALAKLEQISPQSIGATLAALEQRALIARAADPADGRRILMSPTEAGVRALRDRRDETVAHLAVALEEAFTSDELGQLAALAPLLERLAETL